MSEQDDVQRTLGRIEGHIEGIHKSLAGVEARLGNVESRAIRKGAETGGLVSLGVAILAEALRQGLGIKGG